MINWFSNLGWGDLLIALLATFIVWLINLLIKHFEKPTIDIRIDIIPNPKKHREITFGWDTEEETTKMFKTVFRIEIIVLNKSKYPIYNVDAFFTALPFPIVPHSYDEILLIRENETQILNYDYIAETDKKINGLIVFETPDELKKLKIGIRFDFKKKEKIFAVYQDDKIKIETRKPKDLL